MNDTNTQCDIASIEWTDCEWIGLGGYAVVYRVAPGVAAKVGRIEPEEVEAQRHFARQGLALPVWDYRSSWPVPKRIDREVCPVHGLRREILPAGYTCTCGSQEHAVLLMPEADDGPLIPVRQRTGLFCWASPAIANNSSAGSGTPGRPTWPATKATWSPWILAKRVRGIR
jgi:hypothetical protein